MKENRFLEMDAYLKEISGKRSYGQIIKNSSRSISQSWNTPYAKSFGAVDYKVPGLVAPLRQPTGMVCWATVTTMMVMWKRQQSMTIPTALGAIGSNYVTKFNANRGLAADEKIPFLNAAGLAFEYPQSYSIEGWEQLLRNYGPIWITTDEDPSINFAIHARIITAIQGDGTPENTYLTIVDPGRGNQYREKFADFLVKYEQEVRDSGASWSGRIQVVHWPAGVGVAKSLNAVYYQVPGIVSPIKQPSGMVCWATVTTMMVMWKRQQSMTIPTALGAIGSSYVTKFNANGGLGADEKIPFLNAAGLAFEYPSSYSIEGWEQLLRNYGPIWVTTDEDPSINFAIHARIISAIQGDGTAENTYLTIVDPGKGNQYRERFSNFLVKYEQEVRDSGASWSGRIQVVHWPAGVGVAKSLSERTHTWALSQQGIDMIKGFEGFMANLYNDPAGHCTIGYGTLLHHGNCNGDASEQPYVSGVTAEQATQLLVQKGNEFQRTVNDSVTVELNQNQYDALVSLAYNIGSGAFRQSTLLKVLNNGQYDAVPAEMRKWTKATVNGQKVDLPGLVTRRNTEANLFTSPVSTSQSFSYYPVRSFSAVNFTIPGILPELTQPTGMTCWAAVMTMMMSWKKNQSFPIRTALSMIGPSYVQRFDAGQGLTAQIAPQLYADAGLESIISFNPTIEGWEGLLRQYGPLYVDIGFSGTGNTHAIIVKAIQGGGDADNTNITYVDPAIGRTVTVLFRTFLRNYEAEGAVNWPYTIVHWPAGTFSGAKSINGYSQPFYDTGEHAILGEFVNNAISGPLASVNALLPTTTYSINTVPFTYGQIVTMGDFYNTYSDLKNASAAELTRLKTLIIRSENHYKNSILGIGSPAKDVSNAEWGNPTIGIGQRFIDLAIANDSHFSPPPAGTTTSLPYNKQTWEKFHAQAIQTARAGTNSTALDAAYPINAFADHFLTDAFSAGHLINKELVMNRFIANVMTNGKVNSAGDKMFERIADGALAVPAINKKLGKFEVISGHWYEPNWDLNDTGALLPEVFYRILKKVMEDTAHGGSQKIANLAVKAVHDFLNNYKVGGVKGVPVKNNKGNSWNLSGDGTLNLDNIKIIQLAVKQSVLNIEDSVTNMSAPLSAFYQKVWDFLPNLTDPTTSKIMNDAITTFTNPASNALITKAVDLIGGELDTLLDQLLGAKLIQCRKNPNATSVAQC